jgi:SAM-dependent methyltransferase
MSHNVEYEIGKVYDNRFLEFGPRPTASMWFSKKRQYQRFEIIFDQVINLYKAEPISLSDVGCGYGAFLEYLSEKDLKAEWIYSGYDISIEVIKFCKSKFKSNGSFYRASIPNIKTDFIIMSGTFNFFPDNNFLDWKAYFQNSLKLMWPKVSRAMIFNLQVCDKSRITPEGIVYASTCEVEKFCANNFGETRVTSNPILPKDHTFTVIK